MNSTAPATGQFLGWNGSAWAPLSGGSLVAPGSDTALIFNNSSVLAGSDITKVHLDNSAGEIYTRKLKWAVSPTDGCEFQNYAAMVCFANYLDIFFGADDSSPYSLEASSTALLSVNSGGGFGTQAMTGASCTSGARCSQAGFTNATVDPTSKYGDAHMTWYVTNPNASSPIFGGMSEGIECNWSNLSVPTNCRWYMYDQYNGATFAVRDFVTQNATFYSATQFNSTLGVIGSLSLPSDIAIQTFQGKVTVSAAAPGAGFCSMVWRAGTNAGTGKLVAYCGTSATGVTIVDNVGTAF